MRKLGWLLALLAGTALAQTAPELLQKTSERLQAGPWKAELVGQIMGPGSDLQPADLKVAVVPEAEVVRIDFLRPDALADNYLVITPDKVYNYLFLTNQVVVYPRERARVEGLGFDLSRLGDLQDLGARHDLIWEDPAPTQLDSRTAWKLVGRAADPQNAGFVRVVLWIDRAEALPLRSAFYGEDERALSDLAWKGFAFTDLKPDALASFPPDAEWIEKN
ncbi:outer membrane lipoprotein carrier protein LolA [Oceanithermus sp.]